MLKVRVFLAATLVMLGCVSGVRGAESDTVLPAPSELATLLGTIRANRRALVSVNLNLSDAEAAQFWPLYDRYQEQIHAVGDRQAALVADYIAHFADLSNEKALQLTNDFLATEADRIRIRQEFVPEFAKILPGKTVARLMQIENKMDAVLRFDLASRIPVVEDKPAAASQ